MLKIGVLLCLPLPVLSCPVQDNLRDGGIRVAWQDGRAGTFLLNFRGELMFFAESSGGETITGIIGPDGLDRSVTGSLEGQSATFHFVYSFDLPNVPPQPNSGQKGTRGVFVEGVLASSSAYSWETETLTQIAIGDCTYAAIPFLVVIDEGEMAIRESRWWLPDLGLNLPVETKDGFVAQTHPPVEITSVRQ